MSTSEVGAAEPGFRIASSVAETLDALAAGATVVAGGTDLVVGARQGKDPLPAFLVAIDRLDELNEVQPLSGGLRIGSIVNHATLMTDRAVVDNYTAIADGAALVGSPATRNTGTLGGNVMNGSPAMDTGSPLVVLGAAAELQSVNGTRLVPVLDLWTGPGATSATPDELCTAVVLPERPDRSGSAYVRLEYRRAMEIAVVGAAASVTLADDGSIVDAAVALTAVAPTITAVANTDQLIGRLVDGQTLGLVADLASAHATPISDLRAGDAYRRHTVGVMAKRAVDAAARRATGENITVPVNRAFGVGAAL